MARNAWKTNIEPYIKEIERWAKGGATGAEIAERLGVGYSTFRKYAKSEAKLAEALKNGKNHMNRVIDKALAEDERRPRKSAPETPLMSYTAGDNKRPDQNGTHRKAFERNKKRVYATQTTCGICGKPVDFAIKYPNPLSPCVDHIIPVSKGGHPSDISNVQLAHWSCNRQKSDKIIQPKAENKVISNRILPQSLDWTKYKSK